MQTTAMNTQHPLIRLVDAVGPVEVAETCSLARTSALWNWKIRGVPRVQAKKLQAKYKRRYPWVIAEDLRVPVSEWVKTEGETK